VYIKHRTKKWLNKKFLIHSVASNALIPNNNNQSQFVVKLDSEETQNYIKTTYKQLMRNITSLQNGPKAILPNQTTIQADSMVILPLHHFLSNEAQTAYSFPNLTNESLLSVGQLCDDDCEVLFDKKKVQILKNNKIILQVQRSPIDKLYDINLEAYHTNNPSKNIHCHKMNYIIRKDRSKTDLARYLHTCAFSPSLSTFIRAIKTETLSQGLALKL